MFFFIGKFLLKFDPKNVISTNAKDFSNQTLTNFVIQIPLVVNCFGELKSRNCEK